MFNGQPEIVVISVEAIAAEHITLAVFILNHLFNDLEIEVLCFWLLKVVLLTALLPEALLCFYNRGPTQDVAEIPVEVAA